MESHQGPAGSAPSSTGRKVKYWRDPMNASMVSDKPGKSPMGMEMVPVYEDEAPAEGGVHVSSSFLQNFSVRTAVAEGGSIPVDIRTIGILTYNERDIASVNVKFEGWIEKVAVNYIGEPVEKGQALFEIYSPQLVTTQQEYLQGVKYLERLEAGGSADAISRARSLLEASRERLRYWDVTGEQIDALRTSKAITRTLKIFSPVSGIVIFKMDQALEGMKLGPGMTVYKIANLATVWAQIEVYEHQLQYIQPGRTARISVDAFPGQSWTGRILYLDPTINQQTRTLKAFVEIPNADRRLRPQMYANIELNVPPAGGAVKVPAEAILHTGDRNVVIVDKGKGSFEPREVQVGAIGGGYQEIRGGLRRGEVVVTSSQFLIDSESNLREAVSKILGGKTTSGGQKAAPPMQR
ncbi:MAG: efflux RND transporter periplasmic adaptor subunit [Acidobacteriota bacterium]